MRRSLVAATLTVSAVIPCAIAYGDWPMGRHDAQRTGAAAGVSDLEQPETRWRFYLGGSLGASGAVSLDVDGAGVEDYVMAAGGALVARRLDGGVIWQTRPRDIQGILAVQDLDGDGVLELVVQAAGDLFVVDIATGSIEWQAPEVMGRFGGARIADLDGDGLDDILVVDCGPCCAVPGTWPGAAYSFTDGFVEPVELWTLPQVTCGHGQSLTIFDADGDGDQEVLLGTSTALQLLDGATGAEIARTTDLGSSMQRVVCTPIEADGTPGDELVCVHNFAFYASERSVFFVDWGTSLTVPWRTYLSNQETAELVTVDLAHDLGAGPRVMASTRSDATAEWTTHILDASTGAELETLDGELVAGTVPRPGGGRYLITYDATGLTGWSDAGTGSLLPAWERLGDEDPLLVVERSAMALQGITRTIGVLPGTGRLLVVPRGRPDTIRALEISDAATTVAGELVLPEGVRVAAGFAFPESSVRPFGIARSDGYLSPLNEDLQIALSGGDDVTSAGIPTGGYYATGGFRQLGGPPRTADVDGDGCDEVIVHDARSALTRLDPRHAGLTAPPDATWEIADTTAPTLITTAGGEVTIACIAGDPAEVQATYAVTLHAPNGGLLWSSPLPGLPMTDVAPGDLDGDSTPDLVIQWGAAGDVLLHTRALAGVDGTVLWEDVSDPGAGRSPAGVATAPWPGQSRDVVAHVGTSSLWLLAGGTGAPLAQSPPLGIYYFLPMLADVDGDDALEIALTGGFHPIRLFDDDLTQVWLSEDALQRPFPYGALARCPDGRSVLVSQSYEEPARLKLSTISPDGRGTEQMLWLAGGASYPSEEELVTSGVWAGQLTSATVHADLSGRGTPSALVGSSDGYLYLVDPCAGALDTSIRFDAAVGEAVYGDTDCDGRDEILVTTGDGYLHGLQNHWLDAPAEVRDLDMTGSSGDVDRLTEDLPLAASWDAVAGAVGYEAAVVDEHGRYVTAEPWRSTSATDLVFEDVVTTSNRRYRVAVRAVGAEGRSVDAASDGVLVVPDDGSTGSGGGCCDAGSGGAGMPGAVALATMLALVRIRRRPVC